MMDSKMRMISKETLCVMMTTGNQKKAIGTEPDELERNLEGDQETAEDAFLNMIRKKVCKTKLPGMYLKAYFPVL